MIIGSEGAGATAAIEANKRDLKITIVTKGQIAKSGATLTGGADISVDSKSLHDLEFKGTDTRDSKLVFFEDMVKAGKYLNNQKLVEIHVKEAPDRLKEVIDWGAEMWPTAFHASGHTYPRGAFIWGYRLANVLRDQAMERGIEIMEFIMITNLLTQNSKACGAIGINLLTGDFVVFKAKAIVLATGGMMEIYPYSTAPVELTGDGQAMAYHAGAELVDMEFPMFIPAVFAWPSSVQGILFPMVFSTAGKGYLQGWLLNKHGERFMKRWDPENMELTTRDIASIAIMTEILEGRGGPHGGVFVSLKHLPDNLIEYSKKWGIYKDWTFGTMDYKKFIPDLRKDALEATVACHFTNGGIKINESCETNIQGLFATGEVTGGVHGGCRLSGNAFTEFLVWGPRAGRAAAEYAEKTAEKKLNANEVEKLRKKVFLPLERDEGVRPAELKHRIQKLAWDNVGVIRSGAGLEEAIEEIERLKTEALPQLFTKNKSGISNREWVQALEVRNMLLGLEMHARSALMRKESRGAHYRTDFRMTDNKNWLANIVIRQVGEEMCLTTKPIIVTKLNPPINVTPYGRPR